MNIQIKPINGDFSVCKVADYSQVNFQAKYCFLGKTDEENSLVCLTEDVPDNVTECDDGWKAFRVQGVLDFSLIGILSEIATLLAENQIGILPYRLIIRITFWQSAATMTRRCGCWLMRVIWNETIILRHDFCFCQME